MEDKELKLMELHLRWIHIEARDGSKVSICITAPESHLLMLQALNAARGLARGGVRLHSDWDCLNWAMDDTAQQLHRVSDALRQGDTITTVKAISAYYRYFDVLVSTWERIMERTIHDQATLS